jgi:hypothetical protein
LGQGEQALAKAQEAVRIRKQLAHARPDAFGPKLALSTSLLRDCLHVVGKQEPAAEAACEALTQLRPHFLALPQAHAGLMHVLVHNYVESLERVHGKPDDTLLAPVLKTLQVLKQNQGKE